MKKINTLLIILLVLGMVIIVSGSMLKILAEPLANYLLMAGLFIEGIAMIGIVIRLLKSRIASKPVDSGISVGQIEEVRFRTLLGFTIGFTLTYGLSTLLFLGFSSEYFIIPFLAIGLAGWIIFLYFLLRLLNLRKLARQDPRVHSILNDELARDSRLRAYRTGFWTFVIALVSAMALSATLQLADQFILRLVLLAGADAALIHALILFNPTGKSEG